MEISTDVRKNGNFNNIFSLLKFRRFCSSALGCHSPIMCTDQRKIFKYFQYHSLFFGREVINGEQSITLMKLLQHITMSIDMDDTFVTEL